MQHAEATDNKLPQATHANTLIHTHTAKEQFKIVTTQPHLY